MRLKHIVGFMAVALLEFTTPLLAQVPPAPRFSVDHMDRSVDPKADFYRYACGAWLKNNPVPSDKARWSGFDELQERNWRLIRDILESSAKTSTSEDRLRTQVGDFFASAMDTNRIESLRFQPIQQDLKRIDDLQQPEQLFQLLAEWHRREIGALFRSGVSPDAKNSEMEAFQLRQGGLGLPDRDYYLAEGFAKQREAYREHIVRMLTQLGDSTNQATTTAATVLQIETELAQASKSRVDLRNPNANYNKIEVSQFSEQTRSLPWKAYFTTLGLAGMKEVIVGQTNFFNTLNSLFQTRPMSDWKGYLRWHLLSDAAPFLHAEIERLSFDFYGKVLRGQPEQEPRWQRAARVIDSSLGEALGKLYVERHFPPAASKRMAELVSNLREVFQDRIKNLDWMSEPTRQRALAKFDRFTQKIGHPATFRDYSRVAVRRDDYYGNVQRAQQVDSDRKLTRVGLPIDKAEWHMTPQTVNAYFNPLQNEIVFPAAILQPPFFDLDADDAVNYGAIGVVIGHEITHGYDDQGRQFDAQGNLKDWWEESDAKEFERRAQKLVDQYGAYEALPGLKVNGRLTLGENLADLGGTSIAYEALQRSLTKHPSNRKAIDGFSPEQRFFLSLAQLWRTNWREVELRRRLTVDPHSPGQFRAVGPHVNLKEFFDAFHITSGDPMWRPPEQRAKVW